MTLSPTPDNNGPERAAPQRISVEELLRSAIELHRQGWPTLPVGGERGKDALVSGFHGYSAGDAQLDEIRFWPNQFGQRWTHNAVRCPVGVLGIDVDNYVSRGKDKRGLATIAEYERRFGAKLPATYITTAREGGNGIRWYRIPGDYQGPGVLTTDDQLPDGVEPGVELIARHLRYAVVRGIHIETGQPYRLYGPDGALIASGLLPTPAELPKLPSKWVEGLAAQCPTRALVGRLFNRDEIDLWLDAHTGNEYPHGLPQVVKHFHRLVDDGEKNRHKAMFACLCWSLKESYVGGYPAREAEQRLRAEWLAKIAGDPDHDEHEFDNMLRRAIDSAEGDDHGARWARMIRDYATDTRDYAGLVDGVQFHTESTAAQGVCPVSDATVLTYTDATGSPDSITVADFWQSRQVLADLYQFAKSRRCGPWAMLGNVMLRAASVIPPDVVLPPVVGGQASLNLYVAFAGNSGDGKGAATVAADDWLNCDTTLYTAEAGSGEGMVKQFAYKQNQRGQPPAQINMRWSVLFDVREIDTLGAIGGRNSSTMLPILRSAYSGEALGFSYADTTKAIKLCAHRYRFCMGVGVQPKNAGTLLHDSDGGTPQRYVWLPVLDPDMPDERPSAPPALTLRNWEDVAPKKKVGKDGTYTLVAGADHLGLLDTDSRPNERTEITVPEHVWSWLDRQRVEHNRGTKRVDALDAHANQTRLKVAAVLMWLDGRTDKITDDDWNLSGAVMAVSVLTRKWIEQHLSAKADEVDRSIGRKQAMRDHAAGEVKSQMESEDIERVAAKIIRVLGDNAEPVARSKLTQKIHNRDRHLFDRTVQQLVDAEQVRKIDIQRNGETIGYKLALIDPS